MECDAVSEIDDLACIYVRQSRPSNSLEQDARHGLLAAPRSMPPKYFYDEYGSLLFDKICNTKEYYPTRTESRLLENHALELIELTMPKHILEFGSGCSRKTHFLMQACESANINCEYLPFDVCEEVLLQVRNEYIERYQWLDIKPLIGDYTAGLDDLHRPEGSCLYVFLGSSIGNFNLQQANDFIAEVTTCMQPGDSFLLGVDRVKSTQVLHQAYNDEKGVTGEFNLNLLNVLNHRLDADFDLTKFKHKAIYNEVQQRIEMYLVSESSQAVMLDGLDESIYLNKDEEILTEVSHKYTYDQAESLLTDAGLHILKHIEPDNAWFSLVLAHKPL